MQSSERKIVISGSSLPLFGHDYELTEDEGSCFNRPQERFISGESLWRHMLFAGKKMAGCR